MSCEKPAVIRRFETWKSSDSARSIASWISAGILVPDPGDLAGGADQVPEDRLALDDPGVLHGVDGGRRLVRELREIGPAADLLQVLATFERLGDRDEVDRLPPLEELEHRLVDRAVGLAIEVLRLEEFRDLDDRLAIDQDGAQHRLLGFEAVRGQAVDHGHLQGGGRL